MLNQWQFDAAFSHGTVLAAVKEHVKAVASFKRAAALLAGSTARSGRHATSGAVLACVQGVIWIPYMLLS
jgi:hypothetical protein